MARLQSLKNGDKFYYLDCSGCSIVLKWHNGVLTMCDHLCVYACTIYKYTYITHYRSHIGNDIHNNTQELSTVGFCPKTLLNTFL